MSDGEITDRDGPNSDGRQNAVDKLKVGVLGLRRGLAHLRNLLLLDNVEVIVFVTACLCSVREWRRCWRIDRPRLSRSTRNCWAQTRCRGCLDERQAAGQALYPSPEAGCAVLSEVPGAYTLEEVVKLRAAVEHKTGFICLPRTLVSGISCVIGASG